MTIRVVKYSLLNCGPCRILKPTWDKFIEETGVDHDEILLNDYKKEDFPHIAKAPMVEFFLDGESKALLGGKDLYLNKLRETLCSLK